MVYDNINCTDLLCESMQHTDRFQSQRLKPCPRHYLKQSHEISKPQTGMFHQKGDDLNPLNFTQSKWTAETWSLTNAWSRHQIAGSEMRKVHPEDTATGLSPNRYKQPKWAVQLLHYYTQMARNIFYVLMMLCTRGGKTSSLLLCGDFKEEHILKSWKEKKERKIKLRSCWWWVYVNFYVSLESESARFIFVTVGAFKTFYLSSSVISQEPRAMNSMCIGIWRTQKDASAISHGWSAVLCESSSCTRWQKHCRVRQ